MLPEHKNFNIAALLVLGTYIVAAVSAAILRLRISFFWVLLLALLMTVVSIYFGNRTKQFSLWAFVISIIINLIELPSAYVLDGRLICSVPIYFILGIFFCAFTMAGSWKNISVILCTLSCFVSALYVLLHSAGRRGNLDIVNIIIDIIIPLFICSVTSGVAVIFKQRIYNYEKKKAEDEEARSALMNQSKDVFLMNMSHEIRTPMNAIISASELMLSKNIDNEMKQNVTYILNACDALLSSINDLLDFSKVENAGIIFNDMEYNIADIVSDIVNMINVRLMDSDIEFYVNMDPDMPGMLYGDPARMRQLFINLLNNAVKYTKNGHISLNVTYKIMDGDMAGIHVDVEDTGIGIKKENMPELFNAFQRIEDDKHDSRKIEGTGLGLSICREILNSAQGRIYVKSEYNKGSVFSFDIPQKIVDRKPVTDIRRSSVLCIMVYEDSNIMTKAVTDTLDGCHILYSSASDDSSFKIQLATGNFSHIFISQGHYVTMKEYVSEAEEKGTRLILISDINEPDTIYGKQKLIRPVYSISMANALNDDREERQRDEISTEKFTCPDATVMVIDDNKTNRMVAEGLLKRYGMKVITAPGGKEALNLLETARVDMLFIDYMMPDMDGIDTLNSIRAKDSEWYRSVPCIVLTADAAAGAREMLIEAGFNDYISKPIDLKKLDRCIRTFMRPELIEVE